MIHRLLRDRASVVFPVVAFLIIIAGIAITPLLPDAIDWHLTFRPVTLELLAGRNPYDYQQVYFANPPWLLLGLAPLAVLPEALGRAIFFIVSLAGFTWAAYRLGARPLGVAALILSPTALQGLLNANIDWIPLLGATLPPRWGLLLVLIKPQVGLGIAVYWLVETWRAGGLRRVVETFLPVTVLFALSVALYGLWPLAALHMPDVAWNTSLWPYSLPVGVALLVMALRRRNRHLAIASSPCLAPYLAFYSWTVALASLAPRTAALIAAVVGLWALVLLNG